MKKCSLHYIRDAEWKERGRWSVFLPTLRDETAKDRAPGVWWLVGKKQIPPLRYGMEMQKGAEWRCKRGYGMEMQTEQRNGNVNGGVAKNGPDAGWGEKDACVF